MEFVEDSEIADVLKDFRIEPVADGDLMRMRMVETDAAVRLVVRAGDAEIGDVEGMTVIDSPPERLPDILEGVLHRLHLEQVLIIPLAKWRDVFDAVAFSLADNEDWQEVDAAATVELNRRDPLLCRPADFATLQALLEALLPDAETLEHGVTLITPDRPLVVEVDPSGVLRLTLATQVLADEVADLVGIA